METLEARIGQRVRYARMERHWKQKDLAQRVGWQPDYLSRFERGDWRTLAPQKIWKLAQTLGVSLDWLLCPHDGKEENL